MPIIRCEARKKIFTFIFELSGWVLRHLCALKTRKRCFQTIWSHRSLAVSTVAMRLPTGLLGAPPNLWILAEMWFEMWSSWNLTNPTGDYGPGINDNSFSSQPWRYIMIWILKEYRLRTCIITIVNSGQQYITTSSATNSYIASSGTAINHWFRDSMQAAVQSEI